MNNIILLLLSTIIAIYLGFFAFDSSEMWFFYANYIYYFISIIFFLWLYLVIKPISKEKILNFLNTHKIALISSAILVFLFFFICPPEYRVLADETSFLGTSKGFFENNSAFINIEELNFWGQRQTIQIALDKRFVLFPYFLSILHSLKGFSLFNAYILNGVVSFGCLFLLYYLVQNLFGKFYAYIAQIFLAIYPLFVQYSMSAGYDVFSLFWALLAFAIFCHYLKNKSLHYGELLLYTVALLAYTRYECSVMAILILPIMLFILDRKEFNQLSIKIAIYPLLFIPIAWIMFFATTDKYLQQMGSTEKSFSFQYFQENLFNALYYFSGWDKDQNSVFLIALLALLSVFVLIYHYLVHKETLITKIKEYKYQLLVLGIFLITQMAIKFSYVYGDLTLSLNARLGISFLPYIIIFSIYFIKSILDIKPQYKLTVIIIIFFMVINYWSKAQSSFKQENYGYKYFKILTDFLSEKCRNKDDYLIAFSFSDYLAPLNYNVINITNLNKNFNEIKSYITQKKYWKELIIIQIIEDGMIQKQSEINKEIKTEILYEKAAYDHIYIRFSKMKI